VPKELTRRACRDRGHVPAVSPESTVHVSIWDSEEHADQVGRLKEMIVDARSDAEKAGGVSFIPIVNYPVDWVWVPVVA